MRFLEEGRQFVHLIETTLPVEQWKIEGVSIWPFIRMLVLEEFYMKEMLANGQVLNEDIHRVSTSNRKVKKVLKKIDNFIRWSKAYYQDHQANASLFSECDIIFLREGTSVSFLLGQFYCKFANPLLEYVEKFEKKTLLLEPLDKYLVPRYRSSVFIQPHLEWKKSIQKVKVKLLGYALRESLPKYENFLDLLREYSIETRLFEQPERQKQWQALFAESDFFENVLRKTNAKMGIVLDINLTNFAFLLACWRLQIRSLYVFHGAFDNLGPFYADWNNIPPQGYEILPEVFWTWSQENKDELDLWASKTHKHSAVVGGNPFVNMWQSGESNIVQKLNQMLQSYCQKFSGNTIHVLVSLTYALDDIIGNTGITAEQLYAIQHAPKNYRWWLRLHPTQLQYIDELRSLLSQYDIDNVEIDTANEYPLPCLLHNIVNVHVTATSSTATECMMFGVPTIFTHRTAETVYPSLIEKGMGTIALTGNDIIKALRSLAGQEDLLKKKDNKLQFKMSSLYQDAYSTIIQMAS